MGMSFQLAQTNDLPRLSSFVNRAYRGDSARQGWTHEADLLDGTRVEASLLAEELARGVSLIMAQDSGELLGCYHFEMKDATTAYVGMITVDPLRQGQGVGKDLLANATARARQLGAKVLKLTVLSERKELIEYYQRRGFSFTGVRLDFTTGDARYGQPKKDLQLWEMSFPL